MQETPTSVQVGNDSEEPIAIEKPVQANEIENVTDGKEKDEYVIVEHEDTEIEKSIETAIPEQDSIDQDAKPNNIENMEENYEYDFYESDRDDIKEEKFPGGEEAKASHSETPAIKERPVVEITAEFLELMEGFCMAASQEFPNDIIDFASRYFQRIQKRRNALRKCSIEVSDLALFSDVNWVGNI